jgi:hypothetical protein
VTMDTMQQVLTSLQEKRREGTEQKVYLRWGRASHGFRSGSTQVEPVEQYQIDRKNGIDALDIKQKVHQFFNLY